MIDLIKRIIHDAQQLDLPTTVPRRLDVAPISGRVTVCGGARGCGMTTFMFQLIQRLRDAGIPNQNILYLDFSDSRLRHLRQNNLGAIFEAYFSLHPDKKNREKVYCFFDEIDIIDGWTPFLDHLMRTEKCEVFISGSSTRMLSKETAQQLGDRMLAWEMFPFTFGEFLDAKGIDSNEPLLPLNRLTIQKAFEKYWEIGGFPEVTSLDKATRIKALQDGFNTIVSRDIIQRHDVSHPMAVWELAHWLVDNTGCPYSINKLTGHLNATGYKASKAALPGYLEWFQEAYALFTVHVFDPSSARAGANPKKTYCIDHALVTSVGPGRSVNSGHILENMVFISLRRVTPDIFYFKTKTGREVNFIIPQQHHLPMLVQACAARSDPEARQKKVAALTEAMAELQLERGTLVTLWEAGQLQVASGQIDMIPAWRFLLDSSGTT